MRAHSDGRSLAYEQFRNPYPLQKTCFAGSRAARQRLHLGAEGRIPVIGHRLACQLLQRRHTATEKGRKALRIQMMKARERVDKGVQGQPRFASRHRSRRFLRHGVASSLPRHPTAASAPGGRRAVGPTAPPSRRGRRRTCLLIVVDRPPGCQHTRTQRAALAGGVWAEAERIGLRTFGRCAPMRAINASRCKASPDPS